MNDAMDDGGPLGRADGAVAERREAPEGATYREGVRNRDGEDRDGEDRDGRAARRREGRSGGGRDDGEEDRDGEETEDRDGEAAQRRRRIAAWRAAGRLLHRSPAEATPGEWLAVLAAEGPSVYDLDTGVDLYGDGVVEHLERRVAELLGFPAAVFFPTGTMAQQVALRCWAGRTGNRVVALHPLAHPEVHERGALGAVTGLRTVHPTRAGRLPTADEVRAVEDPFGTLMLELPLRDAGFVLPAWEELEEVVEAARERDAVVHFDGARLWETTAHFGRDLPEIAGLADSVYVSFYKSLGGLSGAALVGPESFAEEARAWRHRYGGGVFQQHPAALAALLGLERELPRLPSYAARARVVAAALREGFEAAGAVWFRVHPEVPHTHEFQVWLPYAPEALTEAAVRQAEETGTVLFRRWSEGRAGGPPGVAMTEVTVTAPGLEWTADDVREAVAVFMESVRRVVREG
ncbi:threonine aldolase family protein [Streptomyces sudanensis]|uniref:threonine aldolase family protein n=1 Tax=Streptomyces sudanensis TaxID=436397 RepID=UPI0020CCD91F|nr:beta-eliminating lyase-related protein [Streptomyces sudanensis]MCP9957940.1 beta-eliminating lyase-related protein [Streptomyces sudanensis]